MTSTTVRLAKPEDWPLIESWRAGHFAAMAAAQVRPRPVTGQTGPDDAVWLVVDHDGEPIAATSFTVAGEVCFAHDLYAARGHALSALALARTIEGMCDREGYELRLTTDPENAHYIGVLHKRGYETVAVELKRPRKAGAS